MLLQLKQEQDLTVIAISHRIDFLKDADRIVVLTPRPARVRNIHEIRLEGTPLSRREAPGFGKWFEVLWKELHT
mgnify:CR=1 FL=1